MEFVLASHNPKKAAELAEILQTLGISVTPLPDGAPEPVEDGATFAENARIKARAAFAHTGKPALADDSGLVVDALDGAPGVYSARFCPGTDADRNDYLLAQMQDVDACDRQARFVCAICCILPDGQEIAVEGTCEGEILEAPQGTGGFGYDPLFYVREFDCTFGELSPHLKNRVSHRARALAALREALARKLEMTGEHDHADK